MVVEAVELELEPDDDDDDDDDVEEEDDEDELSSIDAAAGAAGADLVGVCSMMIGLAAYPDERPARPRRDDVRARSARESSALISALESSPAGPRSQCSMTWTVPATGSTRIRFCCRGAPHVNCAPASRRRASARSRDGSAERATASREANGIARAGETAPNPVQ
jgi:hypothetical protein